MAERAKIAEAVAEERGAVIEALRTALRGVDDERPVRSDGADAASPGPLDPASVSARARWKDLWLALPLAIIATVMLVMAFARI